MPLPPNPSTERLYLTGLRDYLTAETGVTWGARPNTPSGTSLTPVAGLWVENDFVPARNNMTDDLTRDQLLAVSWQVKGPVLDATNLTTDWKNYLISVFNTIRRNGITSPAGVLKGIKPYGTGNNAVFVRTTVDIVGGNAADNTAIADCKLDFRYVYNLPARIGC